MKLEKAPLATAGLVLGLLGLGNLLSDVSLVFTASCGILALVTLLYLIYSMMTDPQSVKNQISNPLVSSVFTTFFMSGFLGTVYLKNFFGENPFIATLIGPLWLLCFFGIVSHMLIFSLKYLKNFSLDSVFPSWTVLYIGVAIAGLTSPVSGKFVVGKITIIYGFVATCLVLPIIFKRLKKNPLKAPFKPNAATICAPFSLVAAAYAVTFSNPNPLIMGILLILSQVFYSYILWFLPRLLKRPFSPVFSAFTFPLVISATALKNGMRVLGLTGAWQWLLWGEVLLASVIVLGVFLEYLKFFFKK
ncbi:TDT family transporter [Streptococcus pluranimalium]|uniref:TDT family transporter n=1 Tax=Streptococcus pluranimalium TaxID=82348 RepID=UPI0031389169